MSNPHKGEVEFTIDKKVYTLDYSINAMCELEDKLGGSIIQIADLMSDPAKLSIKNARTLFWAGLRDHHETITETEAGRLMTDIGIAQAMEMVGKAFTLAFPAVEGAGPLAAKGQASSTGKAH